MAAERDAAYRAHQEWLGHVQPVGLVVSPAALAAAQAFVNRNIAATHARFLEHVDDRPAVRDLVPLLVDVFAWRPSDVVTFGPGGDAAPPPSDLEVALPEYGEVLRPTHAVREPEPDLPDARPWLLLVQEVPAGEELDAARPGDDARWHASPAARFERLLRETRVPIGLLSSATHLRLVYAPHGETSGSLTFPVRAMTEPAGRAMFAGLHMLLESDRLFALPRKQRLPAILAESRRFQGEVSVRLSHQVLDALHELLRGFQTADDQTKNALLADALRDDPDHVYAGLLTVLLRLVFVLYAEERGLFPAHEVYVRSYSVAGLFDRLRADADRFPDTMERRYGAWAQLLALFRLVHDGGRHAALRLPPRHGYLFDPGRYPFLEGRPFRSARTLGERIRAPLVSDAVVYRVLQDLLLLDGERISYRTLDVEQIGSVYEAIMGYNLRRAQGRSIAVKPAKTGAAPEVVDLDALLDAAPAERAKTLREQAGLKLTGSALEAVKSATTPEALVEALGSRVSPTTPNIVPAGAMVLHPSDERRRSGSHYTPRSLTSPIVRTTLAPVLEALGPKPTPEQVLDLKVCDPAMGSGAFLVEACRQLGDALVAAWHHHGRVPAIPQDEDEVLHARRLVAQHCLYGVDRNPLAADLAKLSLWLTTLARDHAFTFVDHALRSGDSLVGLTRKQIEAFHWEPTAQLESVGKLVEERLAAARPLRERIQASIDDPTDEDERRLLKEADDALDDLRLIGDLAVSAFFAADKAKEREKVRADLAARVGTWLQDGRGYNDLRSRVDEMRALERPVRLFHWEIEFPEVFGRENPGFDAIVGNPPFAGKNTIVAANPEGYLDWLKEVHEASHGNSDLVAHFFRRAFVLLRRDGAFGLIATKTIRQGDTRSTGLRWICTHGGTIYNAQRRLKWPLAAAAVVVSIVHVRKGDWSGSKAVDGRPVNEITAFLFHAGGSENPAHLHGNEGRSFQGSIVLGMGFTFDDTDTKEVASPLSEMKQLIAKDARNADRIFPYIGGEEVNNSPTHAHHRYVINFEDLSEAAAREWPDLLRIVELKVKPTRLADNRATYRKYWWQFAEKRSELQNAIRGRTRFLFHPNVSSHIAFAFLPMPTVVAAPHNVFALESFGAFSALQSRPHELWARFFGSTMKDDLRYTPSDCFETFPFPENFETHPLLEEVGRAYYEYRAELMVSRNEGLTKTYNRFHDPDESAPDIVKLRELHDAMDRAVLDAYGWTDIKPTCEFLLDYEEEDEEDGSASRRKKPWRYRWPDDVHDEVLARLLELNRRRAEAERLAGATAARVAEVPRKRGRRRRSVAGEAKLFPQHPPETS